MKYLLVKAMVHVETVTMNYNRFLNIINDS